MQTFVLYFVVAVASFHGPLARCIKLRVAHASGMPETFSPLPRVRDPDMHHGTCVTHVLWCMPVSQTSGFGSWWQGKRSRHSRRTHNPQFDVFGKRPIGDLHDYLLHWNYSAIILEAVIQLTSISEIALTDCGNIEQYHTTIKHSKAQAARVFPVMLFLAMYST